MRVPSFFLSKLQRYHDHSAANPCSGLSFLALMNEGKMNLARYRFVSFACLLGVCHRMPPVLSASFQLHTYIAGNSR